MQNINADSCDFTLFGGLKFIRLRGDSAVLQKSSKNFK